jgi:hypothetical protein
MGGDPGAHGTSAENSGLFYAIFHDTPLLTGFAGEDRLQNQHARVKHP